MKTAGSKKQKPANKKPVDPLRKKAEALIDKRFEKVMSQGLSDKDTERLIHELQTHQIELEIQNEELRNTQVSLEDARKRYSDLIDFAPVGYFTLNEKSIILEANLVGASMLGVERARLVGKPFVSFVSRSKADKRDYRAIFDRQIKEIFKKREHQTCEIELIRKDGTVFFTALESVPAEGNVCLTVISDITLRKIAEDKVFKLSREMAARNMELESVNRELESFIYSISHDLRAPLRSMAGFSKILTADYSGALDNQGKDYLTRIQRNSEKMTRLINDLLHMSKFSRQEIHRTEIDLGAMAAAIISDLREANPGRDVKIYIADGLIVFADRRLMEIALSNLLGNAWKFTSKTASARIEVGATQKENETVYYVKDNGAGFDPKYIKKMFWPFQRLHSESEFEGTGIGLTIVDRIIHRHGGRLWADGEVGKGATFFFTMGSRIVC